MSLTSIQKSAVFSTFNHLRGAGTVEEKRLNRALGLTQSQQERPYVTTHESCTCPDFRYRLADTGQKCKHMAALLLSEVAEQAEAPEEVEEPDANELEMTAEEICERRRLQRREEAGWEVDLDEINRDLFGW